jgi:hypothetical protein
MGGGVRSIGVGWCLGGAILLAASSAGAAGFHVRWAPVGTDDALPSFDAAALVESGGTLRVVGLDWHDGGYTTRVLRLAGDAWVEVATKGAPTPGVDGATLVEGAAGALLALVPHDVVAGAPAATFVLTADTWTKRAKSTAEEDRYGAAGAFDAARGASVVSGGSGACAGTFCATTLESHGGPWQVKKAAGPKPRKGAAMAPAGARGVVLFGGEDTDGHVLDDTWAWDGVAWKEVATAKRPPARKWASMAWDPGLGAAVLVGGTDIDVPDVWVLDAGGWELATLDGAPPTDKVTGDAFAYFDHAPLHADPGGGLLLVASPTVGVGTWRLSLARAAAAACKAPGECASGFCADGVCCDAACDGACDACSVAAGGSVDGTCSPRARGEDGVPSCGAARCDGAAGVCPATCSGDGECAPGARCVGGACTEAACTDDGLSLKTGGAPRSCAPYRCEAGECLDHCGAGADCAPGSVCGTDGRCAPAPASASADPGSSGGCATRDRGDLAGALLVAAAAWWLRRRRA